MPTAIACRGRRPTAALAGWAVVGLACLLCACSAIPGEVLHVDAAADFAALDSYAWTLRPRPAVLEGERIRDEALVQQVREAADARLAERGLGRTTRPEAAVHVALHLAVATRQRVTDPDYELQAVERYEIGTLLIDVLDAVTGRSLWRGQASCDLRLVGHTMGLFSDRFVDAGQQREWPVEDLVDAVLAQYPDVLRDDDA